MVRKCWCLPLAVVCTLAFTACASTRTATTEQRRLLRLEKRSIHHSLSALHDEAYRSKSVGALIVFNSDGTGSPPSFADTPRTAARRWMADNRQSLDGAIANGTAVYVFAPPISAPPQWYAFQTLALEVAREDETLAALHDLQEEATQLAAQYEALAQMQKSLTDAMDRLEAFGIDMTRLAVVHQALIDGHQQQLIAFRQSLDSAIAAARVQAATLADGQKEAAAVLQAIASRLGGLEDQLKRF